MNITAFYPRGRQIARLHTSVTNAYQVGRTSSVNTAIARGIRKSDGFGTSGRRKPSYDAPDVGRFRDTKTPTPDRFGRYERSPWKGPGRRASPESSDSASSFSRPSKPPVDRRRDERPTGDRSYGDNARRSATESAGGRNTFRDRGQQRSQDDRPLASFSDRKTESESTHSSGFSRRRDDDWRSGESSRPSRGYASKPRSVELTEELRIPYSDRNIPLSIPYTTPASEFLYGTSVVQAALTSSRQARRKLYKLYVLTTPSREDPEQDKKMISLARRTGVTIQRIPSDGVRLLDKMSAGRPHNGYILEASPLPRLPVKALGAVNDFGFHIELNHQSKEEAEVNGTETFISTQKEMSTSKRSPLVLYLDSIVDPGNLGGIIRTAAFLGVGAIAISTRNSAPFSPVVLKASAGASENVTIFSVDKPSGFIVDSKAAGWKVYAAVAPERGVDRPSIPADKLSDPLADDPVILMLGSEGEGLRWNLRSKADVDVFIRGSHAKGGVDSLNVSVATGILCNSFLRVPKKLKARTVKTSQVSDLGMTTDQRETSSTSQSGVREDEEEDGAEKQDENDLSTESEDSPKKGNTNSVF